MVSLNGIWHKTPYIIVQFYMKYVNLSVFMHGLYTAALDTIKIAM